MNFSKKELRKTILQWYSAEDTTQTDDEFLRDWVNTLIDETLDNGSNWNKEIEFIVLNCECKIEGVRVVETQTSITFMATVDLPKGNGKTRQVSCGSFKRIIDAVKARKIAKNTIKDGYKKPICDCGHELHLCVDEFWTVEKDINDFGMPGKTEYRRQRISEQEMHKTSLKCPLCSNAYKSSFDKHGRLIRGPKY